MSLEAIEIKKDDLSESSILTLENSTNPSTSILNSIMDIKIEKDKIYHSDKIYGNDIKDQTPFRVGNTYALFYRKGEPLIIIGPHWPFFLSLMTTIMTIAFFFFKYLWIILNDYVQYSGICIFAFFFISYSSTMLINPGIPNRKYSVLNLCSSSMKTKKICGKCQIYLEPENKVAHCYECNVCVEGI